MIGHLYPEDEVGIQVFVSEWLRWVFHFTGDYIVDLLLFLIEKIFISLLWILLHYESTKNITNFGIKISKNDPLPYNFFALPIFLIIIKDIY